MRKQVWALGIGLIVLLGAWSCAPQERRGLIILCAGDSITEQAYPRLLEHALKEEGRRVRVLNYGKSGYTTGEYLKYLRSGLEKIRAESPDIVLLQLGTNDVRIDGDRTLLPDFERTLREIVAIFQEFANRAGGRTRVLLATIPPIPADTPYPFSPASARRVVAEINPAIRKIAAELNLVLVDNYGLFVEAPELLPGIHPTSEGYQRLSANWLRALRPFLN